MSGTAASSTTTEPSINSGLLSLGLLAHSSMENERRLPIHPAHLDRIDQDLRDRMVVERGYGDDFQLAPGFVESPRGPRRGPRGGHR